MDLSEPTEEVVFKGVVFETTHLRGWMRPEWFSQCSFRNCVLPVALTVEALAKGANTVEACTWRDEVVD